MPLRGHSARAFCFQVRGVPQLAVCESNAAVHGSALCRGTHQPYLERYGRNLSAEAAAGTLEPVVGRAATLQRMAHILLRRTKNNPVLLGDPGVGKTALVEALATTLAAGAVRPPRPRTCRCAM